MVTLTLALLLLLAPLVSVCVDAFAALRRRADSRLLYSRLPSCVLAARGRAPRRGGDRRRRGVRQRRDPRGARQICNAASTAPLTTWRRLPTVGLTGRRGEPARHNAVPGSATRACQAAPGIGAVTLYRAGFLDVGARRAWVLAPPRSAPKLVPPSQILDGDLATATARVRRGGGRWCRRPSLRNGLEIGSTFTLPSPVPTRLRVAALSTNIGWSPGAMVLNADDYARAWGSRTQARSSSRWRPALLTRRSAGGAAGARSGVDAGGRDGRRARAARNARPPASACRACLRSPRSCSSLRSSPRRRRWAG